MAVTNLCAILDAQALSILTQCLARFRDLILSLSVASLMETIYTFANCQQAAILKLLFKQLLGCCTYPPGLRKPYHADYLTSAGPPGQVARRAFSHT
ncbi:hypothetical protein CEXT_193141 [Caerostris extrusa]|uniref:Uncharacterized protein n=1 Tax=Caerostris extrusa TaxID=172846 RepID=A0AAV4RVI5_CAEEX|nr:hypothetical protein CEXT_192991 [Caerostris extrusa]GIY25169.1 hypothetical protein CEXT_193141 [Caerostris extrusa]